jgi:uncharacterized protein YaiI (UPF0178 family)
MLALNVLEIHGNFNATSEFTTNAYSRVSSVIPVVDTDDYSVAEIVIDGKHLMVLQSNKIFDHKKIHQLTINGKSYNWEGPFVVYLEDKKL